MEQFSPDGRWMVYVSNESGQFEVYLRPYPGPDRKMQVSTQGGTHPKWNRNGKELFYRVGNKMMVVDVSTSPDLTLSQPRVLFEQRYAFGSAQTIPNYDVSPDGQRFVMVKDDSASGRAEHRPQLVRRAEAPRADEVASAEITTADATKLARDVSRVYIPGVRDGCTFH